MPKAIVRVRKQKRRAWSKNDIKVFKQMARANAGTGAIARHFKRKEHSIRAKASMLGISLRVKR